MGKKTSSIQKTKTIPIPIQILQLNDVPDKWGYTLFTMKNQKNSVQQLHVGNICKAYLDRCRIYDYNFEMILLQQWPQLRILSLYHNFVTVKSANRFREKKWPKLQSINIGENPIQDEGLLAILQTLQNNLIDLSIHGCSLSFLGMQKLINLKTDKLKKLNISHNCLGNRGIKYFVKVNLFNLTQLDIGNCQIENEGYKHLAKGQWPNLTIIILSGYMEKYKNRMGIIGWETVHSSNWRCLKEIFVREWEAFNILFTVLASPSVTKINHQKIYKNPFLKYNFQQEIRKILKSRFID